MEYLITSGHELPYGQGLEATFKPVENFEELIEGLNEIYDSTEGDLFSYVTLGDDKIQLNSDVYLISFSEALDELRESSWDGEDVTDRLAEILEEFDLTDDDVDFIKKFILEEDLVVADIVEFLMAEGQEVNVQLIDKHYGSTEATLKS